jgi:excisionase family DNA binding protein
MTNEKTDNVNSPMLTVKEVSRLLHIHPNTVRRWSEVGLIKAYRIGQRGDRRFKREDIDILIQEQIVEPMNKTTDIG